MIGKNYIRLKIKGTVCFLLWLLVAVMPSGMAQSHQLNKLIALKKGYSVNSFPDRIFFSANSFSIAEPGFCLVPVNGGCFLAGFKSWLIPVARQPVLSAVVNLNDPDSSLIVIRVNLKLKKTLVQKMVKLDLVDSLHSLIEMPYGIYDLVSCGKDSVFIWGANQEGSHIWTSDLKTVVTLLNSEKQLNDLCLVNKNTVLVAADSSIVILGIHVLPRELIKLNTMIESIAIDQDGTLYASTSKGIVHFNSMDKGDYDAVTYLIHGKIRIYRDRLFVRWNEQHEVVQIKLR